MKNVAILSSTHSPTVDAMISRLEDYNVEIFSEISDKINDFDLIIGVGIEKGFNGLTCHYSLLPAFNGDEPLKQAILEGVKVTGITIYQTEPYKIIAQYPLVIPNSAHFDEIEAQLKYLEQVIYPIVAEKFIKGEQFEITDIFHKNSCSGSCGSCHGCK